MTELQVGVVDVYVVRPRVDDWRVLTLRRAPGNTRAGAWETIHGSIQPDERPEKAALRELREETGLVASRLYNVMCHAFYLHQTGTVQVAVAFAAFVEEPGSVLTGPEHDGHAWLPPDEAAARFTWPRAREALTHIRQLLGGGDAGPVEDVLRVF